MRSPRRRLLKTIASLPMAVSALPGQTTPAESSWTLAVPPTGTHPWISGHVWANPLQDWQCNQGRIACHIAGGDRNVTVLTRSLTSRLAPFSLRVELGSLNQILTPQAEGYVGFRVGIRGHFNDYRDSALRGTGMEIGIFADGRLFMGELLADSPRIPTFGAAVTLDLTATPGPDGYTLQLRATPTDTPAAAVTLRRENVPSDWLEGMVGLVCSSGKLTKTPVRRQGIDFGFALRPNSDRRGQLRFWFRNLSGGTPAATAGPGATKWTHHPERHFGPILFTQYTVHKKLLKLTAQLAPLDQPDLSAQLFINGKLRATVQPDQFSATAHFRLPQWNDTAAANYEVRFAGHTYGGQIQANPRNKPSLTLGALTCQLDYGFPHQEIFAPLRANQPDLLFFTGDQIYERNADYGIQRAPLGQARLDYLRKWFLFGWAWGELTRNVPTVCLPDDHDVYHGNLWGAAGRKAEGEGKVGQDSGGYLMPANWVNMVQRTQASHLPDAADTAPVDQNISVHFCELEWGGLSLAILEDRKWKSAPAVLLPNAKIDNGFPQNPTWKAAENDPPDAQLLGPRQERFLAAWAKDWSDGVWMKAAVSATIFCNLATLPKPANTDSVTSGLPVLKPGIYPDNEIPVTDYDSNAWPQSKRNLAVETLAQACAFHIAGDQHLASTLQYGVPKTKGTHHNGPFALCTPAISNVFPRRWYPPSPGRNPNPIHPKNSGDYLDGFGNPITVHAVANPTQFGVQPASLNNRAPGFGIVKVHRTTRKISFTNFQRWDAKPYPGWPIEFHQTDNRYSGSTWHLPLPAKLAASQSVVSVLRAETQALLYRLRLAPNMKVLPVQESGEYLLQPESVSPIRVMAVKT